MKLVKFIDLPGRDRRLWADVPEIPGVNTEELRRKVFTGHNFKVDPHCVAGKGPDQHLGQGGGFVGLAIGVVWFIVAVSTSLGFLVERFSPFGAAVALLLGFLVPWFIGAAIGIREDRVLSRIEWADSDGKGRRPVIAKKRINDEKLSKLWAQAMRVAELSDSQGTTDVLGVDDLLLEIHASLLLIDSGLPDKDHRRMFRHAREQVAHLERTVQVEAMRRSGLPVAELPPVPPKPQLIEWTLTGEPVAEQELAHEEELR